MTDTIKFIVDASSYRADILTLVSEIRTAWAAGALPIQRIFQLLPLRVVTPDGQQKLESRGDFTRNGANFTNTSQSGPITTEFLDDGLGRIAISFPASLTYSVTETSDTFSASCIGVGPAVKFFSLPSDIKLAQPLAHRSLRFDARVVSYEFETTDHKMVILEARLFPDPALEHTALAAAALAAGNRPCGNDPNAWIINRDDVGICRIQGTDEFPLGQEVGGPYDSYGEAAGSLRRLQQTGVCQ